MKNQNDPDSHQHLGPWPAQTKIVRFGVVVRNQQNRNLSRSSLFHNYLQPVETRSPMPSSTKISANQVPNIRMSCGRLQQISESLLQLQAILSAHNRCQENLK
jgi:hypothetical protein